MENKYELKESVGVIGTENIGIIISYSRVLYSDNIIYRVYYPELDRSKEEWEADIIKIN